VFFSKLRSSGIFVAPRGTKRNPLELRSSGIFVAPREAKRNVGLACPKRPQPSRERLSDLDGFTNSHNQ
jgi:hypothetical protein